MLQRTPFSWWGAWQLRPGAAESRVCSHLGRTKDPAAAAATPSLLQPDSLRPPQSELTLPLPWAWEPARPSQEGSFASLLSGSLITHPPGLCPPGETRGLFPTGQFVVSDSEDDGLPFPVLTFKKAF